MIQVMTAIFEKFGEGAVEVTDAELAQELGMTVENIRVQKSRGFQRLRELAAAHGITWRGLAPMVDRPRSGKPRGRRVGKKSGK